MIEPYIENDLIYINTPFLSNMLATPMGAYVHLMMVDKLTSLASNDHTVTIHSYRNEWAYLDGVQPDDDSANRIAISSLNIAETLNDIISVLSPTQDAMRSLIEEYYDYKKLSDLYPYGQFNESLIVDGKAFIKSSCGGKTDTVGPYSRMWDEGGRLLLLTKNVRKGKSTYEFLIENGLNATAELHKWLLDEL